jgi:hypothetical protein
MSLMQTLQADITSQVRWVQPSQTGAIKVRSLGEASPASMSRRQKGKYMSGEISIPRAPATPGWRRTALWVVKILVALAFLAAGLAKLAGVPMMTGIFDTIGLGQWFRYVTGAIEVIGGILVLIPSLAAFGGLLLACTMAGGVITHLTVLPGSPIPAVILCALSAVIAWVHRDQLPGLST